MIRIGTIWDRTAEVIAGRGGIIAWLAGMFLFLPAVVQAVMRPVAGGAPSPGLALLAALLGLAVAALAIWGTLAITALASDPAVTRGEAIAIGQRRLPAAIGVLLCGMGIALVVSLVPIALIASSGFDFARAQRGLDQPHFDAARAAPAVLLLALLFIVALWASARLLPLFAVVVNERRGLRAFARAFALTRGFGLRLIGVLLLYGLLSVIVLTAATWVSGVVAGLVFGAGGALWTALVVALVGAGVTAGISVVQSVFGAQFYVATRDRTDAA